MHDLSIAYDARNDIVTIEGVKYSGVLFREFSASGLPVGVPFEITKRVDGVVTIRRIAHDNTGMSDNA